jgi:hypothetical protein
MLSAPEPNDTFDQAYTPPDNIYLEQNYVNDDSVSTATDPDDYLKFFNLYGSSHLYAALDGLSSDADLYIYDQNQNYLASSTLGGNNSETINVDLPGNQYFYVRVHAFSGATNYALFLYNDYAGSTLDTARDIGTSWGQGSDKFWPYGKIFSDDYLDYRDNVDYVKFKMEAPGTISLRMKDFTYLGGLVAEMQLLDSSGNVMTDTSGTVGDGLNLDRYSLDSGTYYVKFSQISGSDPYTFRIVSDYAGDVTGAARDLGDLTNTSRQEYDMVGGPFGLPTYEDASDLYKFTLSKTAPLDVQLQIAQGLTPPTFDASLQLAQDTNNDGFIQPGEVFSQSDNSGDDSISTTLPAGTYYVVVVQNGAYTSYQLDLDSDFDANVGDPAAYKNMSKAINLGTVVGETIRNGGFGISAGDFTDFYKFTVPVQATVTIGACNNGYFSRDPYTPSVAIIRDANNNHIYDDGETIVSGSGGVTKTLAAGTYYLDLIGNGQQIAYLVRLVPDFAGNTLSKARPMAAIDVLNPPTQTFKDYIEQNFGPGSDVNDFYWFDLPETYTVTLTTTGVAGEDLSLSLIKDANHNGVIDKGDILATSDVLNSPKETITRSLAAGRYFVRVKGINGATNYTLKAKFVGSDTDDTIAEVKNLTSHIKSFGKFADFTLTTRDDVDLIKFTAVAGQRASFDVDSRNGSNLDTYLRLFKSDGTQLAANNDGAAPGEGGTKLSYLEYTFTQAGTFYIGVSLNANKGYNPLTGTGDVAGGTTGAYRLYLNSLGTAAPSILLDACGPTDLDGSGRFPEIGKGFTGGTTSVTARAVDGTAEDSLVSSRRPGANFTEAHALAIGRSTRSLDFARSTSRATARQNFDVLAKGTQIMNDFDIFQAAGATKKVLVKTRPSS